MEGEAETSRTKPLDAWTGRWDGRLWESLDGRPALNVVAMYEKGHEEGWKAF